MIRHSVPLIGRVARAAVLLVLIGDFFVVCRLSANEIRTDYLMRTDPDFIVPVSKPELPRGAIELWKETLARPEPDLIKAAAESIATAQEAGFPGLAGCRSKLEAVLTQEDLHSEAAFSVCRALVLLDSRESADLLFQTTKREGVLFQSLIEPALARWGYSPIPDVWRPRLSDERTHRRELLLACKGLETFSDSTSVDPSIVEPLMAIVRSQARPTDVRLAAARAAGATTTQGLEADAKALMSEPSRDLVDDLCAAALIRRHNSDHAQELLLELARHPEPTVAAPALRSLLSIHPSLVLPLAAESIAREDASVRQCGLDAYVARPSVDRIPLIAAVLDDPHPDVRGSARESLFTFGQDEKFGDAVRKAAVTVLSQESWRGQEQSALLLAALDYEPAAPRLVELLASDRPEVMIAAAWGLRVLAVEDTKDGILARSEVVTEHVLTTKVDQRQPGSNRQLAHLFEALVVLNDERAVPVMRKHIPKDLSREISRSAAIWGLGRLLEGKEPDEGLARAIMDRVADINSEPAERALVRQTGAVALGRMNAVSQLPRLEEILGEYILASPVDHALAWSIERMNGDLPPHLPPPKIIRRGWTIEPAPAENRK